MNNIYKNAKIYRIVSNQTDDVYYGSTCNPLSKRLSGHMTGYKKWMNGKAGYTTSYEICIYGDAQIILVEEFPCENKNQLIQRERHYIENNDCVNKIIPGRGRICEHDRQRAQCKECDGASICEHGKHRSRCKECGGSQICEHGKHRSVCKECGGSQICEHGKHRSACKECGGISTTIVGCPFCEKTMRKNNLKAHIIRMH